MDELINTVGITMPEDEKLSSGIGFIALPKDIDRLTYIRDCYQNSRVSIRTAHDGFINRVHVSPDDMNWLEFPTDYTQMGSAIYYINSPVNNQAYMVKRFNSTKTIGDVGENQFKIGRMFKGSLVEISGNPEKGYLNLSVTNDANSKINVAVNNANNKGELNVEVKGNVNIVASNGVNISANGQFDSLVKDAGSDAQTELFQSINSFKFNSPSFSINNGKENFVLGQKHKTLLTNILTDLSNFVEVVSAAQVTTMLGVQPLLNASEIEAFNDKFSSYKDQIDGCLSEVAYIDK